MVIQLTEDLELLVRDAVHTGRYANPDEVVRDALLRLRDAMHGDPTSPDQSQPDAQPAKRLTKHELQRHLTELGLLDQNPEPSAAPAPPDELIDQEGEIVSEMVIRERLIEWLVQFL
jgi:Arc/MetJ-type ribon-helix-helix transcriptional regulator